MFAALTETNAYASYDAHGLLFHTVHIINAAMLCLQL